MGREVGGGIGMGKTCEPKAFSFQCMTKFTTNKKRKKERKKKTNLLVENAIYKVTFNNCSFFKDLISEVDEKEVKDSADMSNMVFGVRHG